MEKQKCPQCEYSSKWKQNITRHCNKKHAIKNNQTEQKDNPTEQKDNPNEQKDNPNEQKDNPNEQKDNPSEQKDNPKTLEKYQCIKCDKILSNNKNYNYHIQKCKGKINKLECQYCKEIFTLAPAKYRHQNICKAISEELIVKEPESKLQELSNTFNATNNGNIDTQVINSNCSTNNIIVFSSESGAIEFVKTPEFNEKLKSFLAGNNHIDNITPLHI